jgi:hypothetical protein
MHRESSIQPSTGFHRLPSEQSSWGSLSGTTTAAAVGGVATFSGLSLNSPGNGYTIQATSNGPALTTTNRIDAITTTPTQLVVSLQRPGAIGVGAGVGFSVVVQAENAAVYVDSSFSGNVSIALLTNAGESTFGGTRTLTDGGQGVPGEALFSGSH